MSLAIRHIVFWKLTGLDVSERAEQTETIRDGLENMRGIVPGLLEIKVGRNVHEADDHFDVVLNALFTDQAGVTAYQQHPLHTAAVQRTIHTVAARAAVDYIL